MSPRIPVWLPAGSPAAPDTVSAALLRGLSRWLLRAARLLRSRSRRRHRPPELEFYAEAGAPEGALYVDGQLVGWLPVNRL